MAWTWDVSTTYGTGTNPHTVGTRSVNLMCYLLKDTTYNQLYDEPVDGALDAILKNLKNLPGYLDNDGRGNGRPIKADLLRHLNKIRASLRSRRPASEDEVIAGHFFHKRQYTPGAGRYRLFVETVGELRGLGSNADLQHFCMPFLPMQLSGKLIKEDELVKDFLGPLGKKKLYDLYTEAKKSYTPPERDAIKAAKLNGIFYTPAMYPIADETADLKSVNLLNQWKCVSGACVHRPGENVWCNSDDNGNCTAASD